MSDLPNGLQPGDDVHWRCGDWHPAFLNNTTGTANERAMLYIRCEAGLYFVGTVGKPSRHKARRL